MLRVAASCRTSTLSGVLPVGSRLPRHVASQASHRLISTGNAPLTRPYALRTNIRVLPGSVRNFSLWPSKPTAASAEPTAPPPPPDATAPLAEEPISAADAPEFFDVPVTDAASTPGTVNALSDALASIPADTVASIPAMHYGDLAALGLASWWPSGLFQWGMEALHVSTGLPWFWTIVGATVFSRVILLPFAVQGMRNAARLAPHQAEMQTMTAQMRKAYANKDMFEQQRLQLKQVALYKKIGVNPASSLISPVVQIPISLGMFFAVKSMCELPVEQLKASGVSFLPDLTVTDPTWILPILTVVAINAQLTVSARDMVANPIAPHLINVFRVMTVASLYLFGTWPTGTQLNVITGVLTLTLQSLVLRIPALRHGLGLPMPPKGTAAHSASMKDTYVVIRNWVAEKIREGQVVSGNGLVTRGQKKRPIQIQIRRRR